MQVPTDLFQILYILPFLPTVDVPPKAKGEKRISQPSMSDAVSAFLIESIVRTEKSPDLNSVIVSQKQVKVSVPDPTPPKDITRSSQYYYNHCLHQIVAKAITNTLLHKEIETKNLLVCVCV